MSAGCLRKPNRLPPPPPSEDSPDQPRRSFHRPSHSISFKTSNSNSHHASYHSSSSSSNNSSYRQKIDRGDYVAISECTSIPHRPIGLKSRTSTSFSSTLKPSTPTSSHSTHQKSRSLTGQMNYLYLDLPTSTRQSHKNEAPSVYNCVDFLKTDALTKCIVERTNLNKPQQSFN